ncbi:unnamed protein product [Didymodactylos carnosus]|uniref:Uncharacterized protein n=1 Tax=Didymodactylos carnosus TaxID=1234261 RepID=A0A813Q622_9BILA|nr:unnamed protein product [Didymodactylos carnosus]CAF0980303.1 unnamed protein product [Didymodactylos carnosus]CAF3543563.1 unnamed protein product [Didymodactylos carnosus]CAF3750923.1 unnamed protein product [Didymodactylos carnosus]
MDEERFRQVWPRCLIIFMGLIEMCATVILVLTELGNIASSFWVTNVFAGFWCGLVMLIHFISLYTAGCCAPKPPAAKRAMIISIIALLATALLIAFDAVFISKPYTCILTSSCTSNAAQTSGVYYTLQQSFLNLFNALPPFKSYSSTQARFLFQSIQLGVGCLCFVLVLIYLIIYFVCKSKVEKPAVFPQPPILNGDNENESYPPTRQQQYPPMQPQPQPGELPWDPLTKY